MNKKQARLLARRIAAQQVWNAKDSLDVGELDEIKTEADLDRLLEALDELRDSLMRPIWSAADKVEHTDAA